jgi:cytoskeleton protein RodZ
LEAGDYERIGPMVYAKGHLRRYAAILGLPADEIMSGFEPAGAAPPVRERRKFPVGSWHDREPSRGVSRAQAGVSLAAALALVGLVWWQPWDHRRKVALDSSPASAVAEVRAAASAAQVDALGAVPEPPAGNDSPRAWAAADSTGGAGSAVARSAALASAPTAAQGRASGDASTYSAPVRARLQLSFTADSWVDVRDAMGKKAFVGNGAANTVKTIAGAAPLHVYLRSASGVQLEINGRAVAIGPQFFSGDVARFEADADGVLRREQTPARLTGESR